MAGKLNIIQIVPRRTVRPDGIGDYATFLAQAMFLRSGVRSVFISATPAEEEQVRTDEWRTIAVGSRTGQGLADLLSQVCRDEDAAAVFVHVSGYGYQKRGVPFWLLEGIRKWRQMHGHRGLLGIFHELFATGHIWNSSFWLSRAQAFITREIWSICDRGIAMTAPYFQQLEVWRPGTERLLWTMPVFSNVGEPEFIEATSARPAKLAVFGQAGVGKSVYGDPFREIAASLVEQLHISEVMDIGPRVGKLPSHLGGASIASVGRLPAELVSEHLGACRFGLLNYDVARLEKSGVFAAYAAHGVIPICIGSQADPPPGLREGIHFIREPSNASNRICAMQDEVLRWYDAHRIARHADLVSSWCLANASAQVRTA